jgi:hypothetical protein
MCRGAVQTSTIRSSVDFYIQVVHTGYMGIWPANDCASSTAGMPPGSQKCNVHAVVTVPPSTQRFICGEPNSFTVLATDGDGKTQPSVSSPPGAFMLVHRQRIVLPTAYNTSRLPAFPRSDTQCCVKQYAGTPLSTFCACI